MKKQGIKSGQRERLLLHEWISSILENGKCPKVVWQDKSQGTFQIPWRNQKSRKCNESECQIYEEYAIHSGRYKLGSQEKRNFPVWKQNLKSALNKNRFIERMKHLDSTTTSNPYRVYRLADEISRKCGQRKTDFGSSPCTGAVLGSDSRESSSSESQSLSWSPEQHYRNEAHDQQVGNILACPVSLTLSLDQQSGTEAHDHLNDALPDFDYLLDENSQISSGQNMSSQVTSPGIPSPLNNFNSSTTGSLVLPVSNQYRLEEAVPPNSNQSEINNNISSLSLFPNQLNFEDGTNDSLFNFVETFPTSQQDEYNAVNFITGLQNSSEMSALQTNGMPQTATGSLEQGQELQLQFSQREQGADVMESYTDLRNEMCQSQNTDDRQWQASFQNNSSWHDTCHEATLNTNGAPKSTINDTQMSECNISHHLDQAAASIHPIKELAHIQILYGTPHIVVQNVMLTISNPSCRLFHGKIDYPPSQIAILGSDTTMQTELPKVDGYPIDLSKKKKIQQILDDFEMGIIISHHGNDIYVERQCKIRIFQSDGIASSDALPRKTPKNVNAKQKIFDFKDFEKTQQNHIADKKNPIGKDHVYLTIGYKILPNDDSPLRETPVYVNIRHIRAAQIRYNLSKDTLEQKDPECSKSISLDHMTKTLKYLNLKNNSSQ